MNPDYWNDWLRAKDAAELIDVVGPSLYTVMKTHRIGTQLIAGRMLFYKPDCERARDALAAKRAKRNGQQVTS